MYSLLDEQGFWRSTVTEAGAAYLPPALAETLVSSVPPVQAAGQMKAWWWDGTNWTAKTSYKGCYWYNPERTSEHHVAKTHDDAPPAGWLFLPPGVSIDPALAEVKDAQWAKIKAARDAAESGGFTWDGSTFDSDLTSQSRIQGAAQMAQLVGSAFSVDWTLADNSTRTLTASEMISVGMAMGTHITATHAKGRELRLQIQAATTAADVEAVVW